MRLFWICHMIFHEVGKIFNNYGGKLVFDNSLSVSLEKKSFIYTLPVKFCYVDRREICSSCDNYFNKIFPGHDSFQNLLNITPYIRLLNDYTEIAPSYSKPCSLIILNWFLNQLFLPLLILFVRSRLKKNCIASSF